MGRKIKQITATKAIKQHLSTGYREGKTHNYRKRCQMILLKLEGYKSSEIGLIVDTCEMTVNNWVASFERYGIEGLVTKAGQGRKPILTNQHESIVRKAVQEERQRLSQAKKIIEENIGRSMSQATLTRFLKVITGVTSE